MSQTSLKAGVVGWPVAHSLSPRLHGFWLKKYEIEGDYVALPVRNEDLGPALKDLQHQGFQGVNLTVPHKEKAMTLVDEVDATAKRVGATNTVVVQADGRLIGRNTDVYGFTQNLLSNGFKPSPHGAVTLLGAGGAARAALVAFLDMGFKDIRIVNRTEAKAAQLAEEFGKDKIRTFVWNDPRALQDSMLLANATSLGLKDQPPLALDLDALPLDAMVTDMVYVPLQTAFLQKAVERGHKAIDGLGMLLHQAKPAFAAFFGKEPEVTADLRVYLLGGHT